MFVHPEKLSPFLSALLKGSIQKSDFPLWATYIALLEPEGATFLVSEDKVTLLSEGFGQLSLSAHTQLKLLYTDSCASTNDVARKYASNEGVFVTAQQLMGRGRLGRTWLGERDKSLFVSFVVKPTCSLEDIARCSLIWMALLAKALDLHVKWPNDLVNKEGRKLGGCLCELVDTTPTLIFGVGLNVHQTEPPIENSTSLHLEGKTQTRNELIRELTDIVYNSEHNQNLDCWRERALYIGRKIRVQDIEGEMKGIREDGALLIGDSIVMTGDVQLVEGS